MTAAASLTFDINSTFRQLIMWSSETVSNNVNFKITGISLEFTTVVNPADNLLNFALTGLDGDGDSTSDAFTVNVMAGTSGNDTISTGSTMTIKCPAGAGNDTINAGAGDDVIIGGAGDGQPHWRPG